MVVGAGTFSGDIAAQLGLDNVYADHPGRYPHIDLADVTACRPGLIVLPDELYPFSTTDGPEIFPGHRVALVEDRNLTWYGPSLVTACTFRSPARAAAIEADRYGGSPSHPAGRL